MKFILSSESNNLLIQNRHSSIFPIKYIVCLSTALLTLYSAYIPSIAAVYYVDAAAGMDNNEGESPKFAWQTINKVNATHLNPGDKVLFKKSQIWRESLIIPTSGTIDNPVTFGTYGKGENPIINAADLVANWTRYQNITFSSSLPIETNRVFYAGTELVRGSGPDTLETNMWYWEGGSLYVNIGINPNYSQIEAVQRDYAIQTNGQSNIVIDGLHLKYNNKKDAGVLNFYPGGSSNVKIVNNIIEYGIGDGIRAEHTGGDNLSVSNNIVRYNKMWGISAGSQLSIGHSYTFNKVYQNGTSGFLITARKSVFSKNKIYRNPNYSRGDGRPNHGFYMYNYDGGGNSSIIEDNEVYGFNDQKDGDSALRLSGSNCIVRYNYFHDNDYGMYLIDAEQEADGNKIYYNVFSGINEDHYGLQAEGATNSKIYNNTFIGSGIIFLRGAHGNSHTNSVINNVISVGNDSGATLQIAPGQQKNLESDNNLFYPDTGKRFMWRGKSVNFTKWVKRANVDHDSITDNPLFVDSSTLDRDRFSLSQGSPARMAGRFLGLANDIKGTVVPDDVQPNIGSFQ